MNFNSAEFLVFLPVVLLVYSLVFRRESPRDLWLLAASYFFYMSWDWRYAGLILFSTVIDFVLGARMAAEQRASRRKLLVTMSLVVNLGLLALFKYFDFFMNTTQGVLGLFGVEGAQLPHVRLLLPVGISFYTFQSLSYTIDLYRREIPPERNFVKFALFVSFFPRLVAGPIVRASEFLPQLQTTPEISDKRSVRGAARIFRGLFKKIVFADLLAGFGVDTVFADPSEYSSATLLLAVYGYSFQIYNDFSGYSDIAIGAADMLGFKIPENFNRPYLSRNPREFWTRWHISLSTWLRDYLYVSLGGNRSGPTATKRNLLITMVLGGLWHGAALNFVFWGLWHGLLLIVFRRAAKKHDNQSFGTVLWQRFLCFHLIAFSWLLFRIGSLDQLGAFLSGLTELSGGIAMKPLYLFILGTTATIHFLPKATTDAVFATFCRLPRLIQGTTYALLVFLFVGLSMGDPSFIYFQF